MYKWPVEGDEKVWGLENMSTLDTVNSFRNLYASLGRQREIEAVYERVL